MMSHPKHPKCRQRIALAEEHHCWFIKPVRSSESGLPLIGLLNPNIVVPSLDVQFGEVAGMFESINKIRDTRERISILDGVKMDISVVLAGMEHAILLWDKEEGGCLQGL